MADKKRKLESDAEYTPSKRSKLANEADQFLLPPTPTTYPTTTTTTTTTNLVPTHSSWFKLDQVNEIEKRAFAEFFNAKSTTKTPELYVKNIL